MSDDTHRYALMILLAVVLLVGLGISFIYSSSAIISLRRFNDPYRLLYQQLISAVLGLAVMSVAYYIPSVWVRSSSRLIMLAGIIMLVMVFVPAIGLKVGRAHRWLSFGRFTVQPSVLLKIILPLYLIDAMVRKEPVRKKLVRGLLPLLVVTAVTVGLILLEPDFGTAVVIMVMVMAIIFVGGVALKYLGVIYAVLAAAMFFAVRFVPYRWKRVLTFIDPFADPYGKGYQIIQSHRAFANGGIFGVGLGNSRLKQGLLPEPYGDFIYAIIGEETGLVGALVILSLYGMLCYAGVMVARTARDRYHELLGFAMVIVFAVQALTNMAVVLGVLPTTGLTLPFVSKGGSSLVAFMAAAGFLLKVSRRQYQRGAEPAGGGNYGG